MLRQLGISVWKLAEQISKIQKPNKSAEQIGEVGQIRPPIWGFKWSGCNVRLRLWLRLPHSCHGLLSIVPASAAEQGSDMNISSKALSSQVNILGTLRLFPLSEHVLRLRSPLERWRSTHLAAAQAGCHRGNRILLCIVTTNPCLMWPHYILYEIKITYTIITVPTPTVAWTRA